MAGEITFGTPTDFTTVLSSENLVVGIDDDKFSVLFDVNSTSDAANVISATVSGLVPTFGVPIAGSSNTNNYWTASMISPSPNITIGVLGDNDPNVGVYSTTGNTIKFISPGKFSSNDRLPGFVNVANTPTVGTALLNASDAIFVAYPWTLDGSNNITVGTVKYINTSIPRFGSNGHSGVALDSERTLAVYTDIKNSNYATAIIITNSSGVISFGTPVVFKSEELLQYNNTHHQTLAVSKVEDNKVVVSYITDIYNSGTHEYRAAMMPLIITGTSITVGTEKEINTSLYNNFIDSVSTNDDGSFLVSYQVSGQYIKIFLAHLDPTTNTITKELDQQLPAYYSISGSHVVSSMAKIHSTEEKYVFAAKDSDSNKGSVIVFELSSTTPVNTLSSEDTLLYSQIGGNETIKYGGATSNTLLFEDIGKYLIMNTIPSEDTLLYSQNVMGPIIIIPPSEDNLIFFNTPGEYINIIDPTSNTLLFKDTGNRIITTISSEDTLLYSQNVDGQNIIIEPSENNLIFFNYPGQPTIVKYIYPTSDLLIFSQTVNFPVYIESTSDLLFLKSWAPPTYQYVTQEDRYNNNNLISIIGEEYEIKIKNVNILPQQNNINYLIFKGWGGNITIPTITEEEGYNESQ